MEQRKNLKTKNTAVLKIAYIALMAVVITLCSYITVPSPVPFTMQTFGIFLALLLLGGKSGTISILIYVLLGAVGFPVFSAFGSGLGYLLGPTGGYIFGFILCGVFYLVTTPLRKRPIADYIFLFMGLMLCYLLGTVWFVYAGSGMSREIGFLQTIIICVLPYIIPDILKLLLAGYIAKRLGRAKAI